MIMIVVAAWLGYVEGQKQWVRFRHKKYVVRVGTKIGVWVKISTSTCKTATCFFECVADI